MRTSTACARSWASSMTTAGVLAGRQPRSWLQDADAERSWVFDQAPVTVAPTRNVVGHVQIYRPPDVPWVRGIAAQTCRQLDDLQAQLHRRFIKTHTPAQRPHPLSIGSVVRPTRVKAPRAARAAAGIDRSGGRRYLHPGRAAFSLERVLMTMSPSRKGNCCQRSLSSADETYLTGMEYDRRPRDTD